MPNVTLTINGEERSIPQMANLRELIAHLGIAGDRIAVEVNRRLIRRKDWEATPLNDSDRIEVVEFVGGG